MAPVSFTGTGIVIYLVRIVLTAAGVEYAPGSIEAAVDGLAAFVALVLMVWGQLRRKDLDWGLIRKS